MKNDRFHLSSSSDWQTIQWDLKQLRFGIISALPLRKKPFSWTLLGHELGNQLRFFMGKRNLFGVTLIPELYTKLLAFFRPNQWLLYRFFLLNQEIESQELKNVLGEESFQRLDQARLIEWVDRDRCRCWVRIVPYKNQLYLTDRWDRQIENMSYLSYDSMLFADWLRYRLQGQHFNSGLDIGTGVGILANTIAPICKKVHGLDINERSIGYAQLNAVINQVGNVTFSVGDLHSDLAGSYDLVVANPPFVFLPDSEKQTHTDSFGGHWGIGITLEILMRYRSLINKNGRGFVLSKAPIVDGEDVLEHQFRSLLNEKDQSLVYHRLARTPIPAAYRQIYEEAGISDLFMVILEVRRDGKGKFQKTNTFLGEFRYQF